jgi:hypothetical protein
VAGGECINRLLRAKSHDGVTSRGRGRGRPGSGAACGAGGAGAGRRGTKGRQCARHGAPARPPHRHTPSAPPPPSPGPACAHVKRPATACRAEESPVMRPAAQQQPSARPACSARRAAEARPAPARRPPARGGHGGSQRGEQVWDDRGVCARVEGGRPAGREGWGVRDEAPGCARRRRCCCSGGQLALQPGRLQGIDCQAPVPIKSPLLPTLSRAPCFLLITPSFHYDNPLNPF